MFLGLDKLHNLTTGTPTQYEVRADLQTANESAYAVYDFFQVASSKERYKLTVGKYRGTAGKRVFLLQGYLALCFQRIALPCAAELENRRLFCGKALFSLTLQALFSLVGGG
jgi:hypothetical protein